MTPGDVRDLALVAMLGVAPLAVVALVALLRGYTIEIHLTREHRRRRWSLPRVDGDTSDDEA